MEELTSQKKRAMAIAMGLPALVAVVLIAFSVVTAKHVFGQAGRFPGETR